jgi:hypothetical protein
VAGELRLRATNGNSHPDKILIGRIEKGFDFLGYHFAPDGLGVPKKTVANFVARAIWLYEREPGGLFAGGDGSEVRI